MEKVVKKTKKNTAVVIKSKKSCVVFTRLWSMKKFGVVIYIYYLQIDDNGNMFNGNIMFNNSLKMQWDVNKLINKGFR